MHANNWQFISKSFKNKKKFISRLAQPSDGCFVKKFMQAGAPDGGGASSHLLTTHLAPLTVRAAVVLGRDGALHGPRGWAAGQCRCREREREMEKQRYYQANQGPSPRRACCLSRKPR